MKKYRFSIRDSDITDMWEFAKKNNVNFHFVRKPRENSEGVEFEGFMVEETYIIFKLSVPIFKK